MSFSTYADPAVYTDPSSLKILEPSPEVMPKLETSRYEDSYTPLLQAFLDASAPIKEPFIFGDIKSMSYYIAFIIVAAIGSFYIYTFMRTMFAK